MSDCCGLFFFFFNDTATTEIYTLSLHDALPISSSCSTMTLTTGSVPLGLSRMRPSAPNLSSAPADRKSTRLNSSHANISYAVFCLKKQKNTELHPSDSTQLSLNYITNRNIVCSF